MSVTHATSVAQSGMEVASRRLAVSAHNVANINTEGFQAMDVVAEQVEIGGNDRYIATCRAHFDLADSSAIKSELETMT